MKNFVLSLAAAATMCGGAAIAADMPVKARPAPVAVVSPWDWAFGGALMSDYNFRGISQSNRGPSVTAYSEARYNVNSSFQLYLATQYWAVTLPTNPTAEVDIYGGARFTQGPFTLDIGGMYYWYPRERQYAACPGCLLPFPNGNVTLKDTDFWEVYGKLGWEVIKDKFAVGANVYYAPDWLNTGADALFASASDLLTKWVGTFRVRPATTGSAPPSSTRSFTILRSTSPTMPPGTSAWPSPGRLRPSTCATTTPTCRRKTATS
jgi:hypothetical protein